MHVLDVSSTLKLSDIKFFSDTHNIMVLLKNTSNFKAHKLKETFYTPYKAVT